MGGKSHSKHEEVILSFSVNCIVTDQNSRKSQTCYKYKEKGVVEELLKQVESCLWWDAHEENVETIGEDLSCRF